MKMLIALTLAIAAAGLSATPATAQLADNWRTGAGFQWDDGVQTLNWSTATIAALGFIGGGAIIENSTERIRHIRCDGSLLEFQIRQSDGSYLTVSANEATAFTGLLLPSGGFGMGCSRRSKGIPRAQFIAGGLLTGVSGGYLFAKFLPWPGSPGDRGRSVIPWGTASLAALGLIGSAWMISEIVDVDECSLHFRREDYSLAAQDTLRTRRAYFGPCTRASKTDKGAAQIYAAGGLLLGTAGGYALATFFPGFRLPWPVAPATGYDAHTGTPLFGIAIQDSTSRHRIELKTDAAAETATLHYRWRW